MSVDLKNDETAVAPEIQAVLDLFDRLSEAAKRETMIRLLKRRPPATAKADEAVAPDDLDWGEITDDDRDLLTAEAFAEMDQEEEEHARGVRRGPR